MKLTTEKLLELLPDFRLDARGKNLVGICPQCGHNEFGISLEEGHRFGCYRKNKCGFSGNIITLLRYFGKLDEVLQEKVKNLPNRLETVRRMNSLTAQELPNIAMPVGWKRVYEHSYLESRGFQEIDYERYPVGITNIDAKTKKNYVIFQCIQDKQIKGWVARHRFSKKDLDALNEQRKNNNFPIVPRYINSFSDFGEMCYGIDEVSPLTSTLVIVEGIFDKINIDKLMNIYHQDEIRCIATYKAAVSEGQMGLIHKRGPNINNIILLYDSDVIKSIKHTISVLQGYYNVLIGYHKTKDPGDMNTQDLEEVLENLLTPIEFKSFKLEVNKI